MRKKRVDPALVLWSAAIVLFAGAFFLGRATLRGPLLETQRTAPGSTAWEMASPSSDQPFSTM